MRQRWLGSSISRCSLHACSHPFGPCLHSTSRKTSLYIYVQSDTLRVDATIASLFSKRAIDAIESGMTTSIVVQFRLRTGRGDQVGQRGLTTRLEHDNMGRGIPPHPTSRAGRHVDTRRVLRTFDAGVPDFRGSIWPRFPCPTYPLTLQVRIDVNPISPEQQERTRRCSRFWKRAVISNFFIRWTAPPSSEWVDVIKFRPSALPHLLEK